MEFALLLETLAVKGIRVSVAGERLACDAPCDSLTPEIRAALVAHRDRLLAHLAGSAAGIPVLPRSSASFPLSHAQQRLWLLDRLEGGSPRYNLIAASRLSGALDLAALQQALAYLVRRHEILRSGFLMADGEPRQVVLADAAAVLRVEDFSQAGDRDAAIAATIAEEARQAFDLAVPPLLRVRLLRFAPDDHALVTSQHHIVTDAWSQGIFARELAQAYAAYAAGFEPALPPLAIQYADFAAWQRQTLSGAALQTEVDFWREELADLPELLALPADFPRPATQTYRGAALSVRIPAALTGQLRQLGRDSGASLFMVVYAALCVCLGRHAASNDIAIGTPVANRNRPEVENLIGFFVNTLVLRCRLDPARTFRELLGAVRDNVLRAFAHQEAPFDKLIDTLQVRRDLSYSPLFQVMLSFLAENGAPAQPAQGSLAVSAIEVPQQHVLFDLDWQLRETPAGIEGHLIYAADLFSHERAVALVAHLENLLAAVAAQPDRSLAELDMLAPAERQRLLVDWNATAAEYPRCGVHELFRRQVQRTPQAVAVSGSGESWTYAELDVRARRIAAALRARGAGPGKLVGICAGRSPRTLAALLGVLMSGAAYVPLDPGFPAERLAYMVADSGAVLVLSEAAVDAGLRQRLAQHAPLCLLEDLADAPPLADDELAAAQSPESLMYAIYTSGSTGQPKGVLLPHCAVVNFLTSMARQPGLTADDALLAVTTLSFDIAVLELFLPLTVGARVVLATQADAVDPRRLIQLLESEKISVMQATPATWRMLLAAGWAGSPGLTILCGGEALPRDLSRSLLPRCRALWNMYGPTETAIWSAVQRVTADDGAPADGVEPVGRPIANTRLYVLSPELQPIPAGAVGELCIGGAGLAHGYLNRPELSAEKFVADPYAEVAGARMYRTGDRARFLADGRVEFLGRLDHQVKLRGFRIELGEIESLLGRDPAVAHCVVMIREDVAGDQRLVAYLVANPGAVPDPAELRLALRGSLPEYMIPAAFVVLPQMPLTPNGKVDRKALPRPEAPTLDSRPAEPAGELETLIARRWEAVLNLRDPSLDANFFDLGGHSLLIIHLHQQLVAELGVDFEVLDLFRHPTIRQQAALLGGRLPQRDLRGDAASQAQRQRQAFQRQRAMAAGKAKHG